MKGSISVVALLFKSMVYYCQVKYIYLEIVMQKIIQFVARCIDSNTGDVIEECIMREETVAKAPTLKELG